MSQFTFTNYKFDEQQNKLELHYKVDDQLFTETYVFNCHPIAYDPLVLDRALQNLFFIAGVSYFKTKLPEQIVFEAGQLDSTSAAFFSETWQKGLGEFFYVNKLDPNTPITFPSASAAREQLAAAPSVGKLVALGGGKDSLVSVELLCDGGDVTTWSLGHATQLKPLVDTIGLPHVGVERTLDPKLLELNKQTGIYNGHVPISAIFACVGTVLAVLIGKRDIVMSNESSADEPTLEYNGVEINHQYSKSSAFEQAYQKQLERDFGSSLRYYSFLRPLSELAIAEVFAQVGLGKYGDVFSSCNRAFTLGSTQISWCGQCPKCAFTFLALTPFVGRQRLEDLFGGKNLLEDPALVPTYLQLLGIEVEKPLECVGEIRESRAAMHLASEHIPSLNKYAFELPANYNFRELSPSYMPPDARQLLETKLSEL